MQGSATRLMLVGAVSGVLGACAHHGLRKADIYEVIDEVSVGPGQTQTATAQCREPDHVVLSGLCQTAEMTGNYRAFGISNAAYNSQPASKSGWACTLFNPTSQTILNQAKAACVETR